MAIKSDKDGTDNHLRDSRFHIAALRADPAAKRLIDRTVKADKALRDARSHSEDLDGERLDAWALFIRSDVDADALCSKISLGLLELVGNDRSAKEYVGCLPHGVTDLTSLRGAEQATAMVELGKNLKKYAAALAKKYGAALSKSAKDTSDREEEWKAAEVAYGSAFAEERIARTGLVEQLRKNEGALRETYPGQAKVVQSFYRPGSRKASKSAPTPTPTPVDSPVKPA